ncbi:Imm61 family immunity protein [Buchananella felis]|uniref:Imm61 family immunity protein n=1 Tax=Buchananella felis TaxID=3231492 RepID=UPI0035289B28
MESGSGYAFGFAGDLYIHIYKERGLYKVGGSERASSIWAELFSSRLDAAERWFIKRVGEIHRHFMSLPEIKLPGGAAEVNSGYEVRALGAAWSTLDRSDGTTVPITMSGDFTGKFCRIVEYSHIADLPVGDLAQSYMDPAGAPLLSDYVVKRAD